MRMVYAKHQVDLINKSISKSISKTLEKLITVEGN